MAYRVIAVQVQGSDSARDLHQQQVGRLQTAAVPRSPVGGHRRLGLLDVQPVQEARPGAGDTADE